MSKVGKVDGVVKEVAWRNPHAFVVIEEPDGSGVMRDWTFELNATPVLLRLGVTEDSLKPGEHVVAYGNPDRDAGRRFLYANVFIKDDGREVWLWGKPGLDPYALPTVGPGAPGSTDFTGAWMIELPEGFDILTGDLPTTELVTDLPVNEKGQALVEAFDPAENPELDCQPMSLPTILRYPYPFKIVRVDESTLEIVYEVNHLVRVVHLGMREHPADVAPSPYGHSIGWIEDGALVVETARFSAVRWGAGDGVDSSERKTTREVYRLADGGRALELTVTLEDPEYLRAPATSVYRYRLAPPDIELQDFQCDPATARRHLTAGR